jgi:murein DD-endopeptidase MepM/ murein hydrolase activator NlpD
MQKRTYTVILAHDPRGRIRKLKIPGYLVHLVLLAALLGLGSLLAGVASYGHLLLTLNDYQQLRAERAQLRAQNRALQSSHSHTRQRLLSLEALANEVAASYGLMRLRQSPFGSLDSQTPPPAPAEDFRHTLARYRFLQHHAAAVTLYASGVRPLPGRDFSQLNYTPSLWPVRGRLTGGFGNRLDPFNGEGSFHAGVDISAPFGNPVRAAATGFVVWANRRSGSGRLVVVDHGAGLTTWYAHLSQLQAYRGQAVERGDVIGYVGSSGRSTGPHLHYEVRLWEAPVNPRRFLSGTRIYTARAQPLTLGGGDD